MSNANPTMDGADKIRIQWCTPVVRVLMRMVEPGDVGVFINGRKPVIQQAWQGNDGSIEWRDVPIVLEP